MPTPAATPPVTPTSLTALPKLATVVEELIATIPNRKTFNEAGFKDLPGNKDLTGPDIEAFLSFDKGTIGCQVLGHLPKDPTDFIGVAKKYADWILKLGEFDWKESEETEYPDNCATSLKANYGYPKIQLRGAKALSKTSLGGDLYRVKVQIDGEGFLPGCRVDIYTVDQANPDDAGDLVDMGAATIDGCSTFRFGRVTAEVDLKNGKYRVQVVNLLQGGHKVTIGEPKSGSFDVT